MSDEAEQVEMQDTNENSVSGPIMAIEKLRRWASLP